MSWSEATRIAPILWLTLGGVVLLLVDAFVRRRGQGHLTFVSVVFLVLAALAARDGLSAEGVRVFAGALVSDAFTAYFNLTFLVTALLTIAVGATYFQRMENPPAEFFPLVMFATVGMMVFAAANDLIALFVGLETMSVALYVLAAIQRHSLHSNEAGFKYLLLGAFSSAFLLYGMALLYGTTGTTNLSVLAQRVSADAALGDQPLFWLGWALMVVGLGFKVAMVPFHMWTPDVYEGSPAPVAGFMAAGVKAASFAALLRVAWTGMPAFLGVWEPLLVALAVLTMTVGNVVALAQSSLKRMLAYSAIAHAGYLLVGVVASGPEPVVGDPAARGMLFYLLAYAIMNLGAFGLVSLVSGKDGEKAKLSGFAGLARRSPLAAACMTVFLLSLAGIPPTAGFWGKLYVFQAAIDKGYVTLAVIALLNSAVAVFYYLRVIVVMYMRDAGDEAYQPSGLQVRAAMAVAAVAILWFGLFPGPMAELARQGARALAASF